MHEIRMSQSGQPFGPDSTVVRTSRFVDSSDVDRVQWLGDGVEQDVQVTLYFVDGPELTIYLTPFEARELADGLAGLTAEVDGVLESEARGGRLVTPSSTERLVE